MKMCDNQDLINFLSCYNWYAKCVNAYQFNMLMGACSYTRIRWVDGDKPWQYTPSLSFPYYISCTNGALSCGQDFASIFNRDYAYQEFIVSDLFGSM